jgi:O-antigen ligase
MESLRPLHGAAIVLGFGLVLLAVYTHLQYFGDITFLGGILLLEVLIICLWQYDQRFFLLLMVAFIWAGMPVPMQNAWTSGRWAVLAAGAFVGYIVWMKAPRRPFGSLHLIAFFCVCAAFVSATVSPFIQMASFKALSLLLLFLYCASGARLAVLGRENHFFNGLLLGSEIAVYITVICYFGLGQSIWGNPNSLGAAMSIGVFPVLLWGWFTSETGVARFRRLAALLLCTCLVYFSLARSGMAAVILVTVVFSFSLRQHRLLLKAAGMSLCLIAVMGIAAPKVLVQSLDDFKNVVLYKGNRGVGVLGSRRAPWEKSVDIIKEHPLFGTGYGTSPTGEDPGLNFGRFSSSAESSREHGSSYLTIAEWVGLLGVLPFFMLIGLTALNVGRVCVWMHKTANPRHYSIPLAMVLLSGLIHAGFEDWLFAVGAYPCVYFWVVAFVLADLVPAGDMILVSSILPGVSRPGAVRVRAIVPSR